ncbi:putative small nuclear ribonucleoprotein G isoform X1 [Capsicum annuum]
MELVEVRVRWQGHQGYNKKSIFLMLLNSSIQVINARKMARTQVKLNANRLVTGTLRGFDQFMNLVIDNTVEVNGNEKNEIGMVVIRGNSVVTIEALEPVARPQ